MGALSGAFMSCFCVLNSSNNSSDNQRNLHAAFLVSLVFLVSLICPWCVPCHRLQDEGGAPLGPFRVWFADTWAPGLAMSRAIGDVLAKECVAVAGLPVKQ